MTLDLMASTFHNGKYFLTNPWKVVIMSTTPRPTSHSTSQPSPQDAQDLLNRATELQHSVAGFSLSWLGFFGICAGGALYAIAASAWEAAGFSHTTLLLTSLTWIILSVIFITVVSLRAGTAPRGFSRRWIIMLGLWVALWVATVFLAPGFTALQATGMSLAFLITALTGPAWELFSMKRGRK